MQIAIAQGVPDEHTKEGFERLFGEDRGVVVIGGGTPICQAEDDAIKVNVGALGFAGLHKARLRASIAREQVKTGTNKSDRKRNRKNRWR